MNFRTFSCLFLTMIVAACGDKSPTSLGGQPTVALINNGAQPSPMEFRVFADSKSGDLFYIAPTSISKTGNVVSAWSLNNFSSPTGAAKAKSKLGSVVVDCKAREMQEDAYTIWSEPGATGTRLGLIPKQPVVSLPEGTPAGMYYSVLCRPYAEVTETLNALEKSAKESGIATRINVSRTLTQ